MAVDTARKRESAMSVHMPWTFQVLPIPNGSVGTNDRADLLGHYIGIVASGLGALKRQTLALLHVGV